MKLLFKTAVLIFIVKSIASCSPRDKKGNPKVKKEVCVRYWFRLGNVDKDGDSTITIYNEFGNPVEETSSSTKKTFTYEQDTLLTSETQYSVRENTIWYKKNISYNAKGLKESLKIYTSFTNTKVPELVAGMKFFYDPNNKIIEKKYFGGIQYNEEEIPQSISNDPNGPDILDREKKRRADSSSAQYIRDNAGKITRIIFNHDTSNYISYLYNKELLIVKERKQRFFLNPTYLETILQGGKSPSSSVLDKPVFTGTRYYYSADTLIKSEEFQNGQIIQIKKYNKDKRPLELKQYIKSDEPAWKFVYTYDEYGNLKEVTKFDDINEPQFVDKYFYEYY